MVRLPWDREPDPVAVVAGSPFTTASVPLALKRAVWDNDVPGVREHIHAHAPALATAVFNELNGDTLLHIAVRRGHEELVRYLVAQGADRGAQNGAEQTPLQLALRRLRREAKEMGGHPPAVRRAGRLPAAAVFSPPASARS